VEKFLTSMNRRTVLKGTAAGIGILAAPAIISSRALASSGELNFMGWAGYPDLAAKVFPAFEKATGIKVNFNEQPDQDAMLAQAKLSLQTGAVDFLEPTVERTQAFVENGIIQPWDMAKLDIESYEPGLVKGIAAEMATFDGQRYFVPAVWGTEALVFNTEQAPMEYGTASLGDLFDPKYAGAVTVRPHSALAAMGRYLDSQGKLPHPFVDSYKNMDVMKANWDVILVEAVKAKPNIAQFWKSENEAQAAFRTNGCVLGQCWDSTGFNLQSEGLPIAYLAPKEGAFAWNQGFLLLKNATNVEQATEYAKFIATPEGSALHAASFRANPVAKGAIDLADPKVAAFYKAAYPGDALSKLWWWPTQSSEFLTLRNEYADRFQSA
jgi:spermidine/putrescine transport system substrate-binding protein